MIVILTFMIVFLIVLYYGTITQTNHIQGRLV